MKGGDKLKIVVIVDGGHSVTFEGEKIQVSNTKGDYLLVRDMAKKMGEPKRELGVFKSWLYWMEIEQKGSKKKETEITYGETDKIRLINKDGTCVAVLYILPDGNLKVDSWIRTKAEIDKLIDPTKNDTERYASK